MTTQNNKTNFEDSSGTKSSFARDVSAHVRALLGARRLSGKALASMMDVSQNYISKRLRDEAPFTLDDIDQILTVLEVPTHPGEFLAAAENAKYDNFDEMLSEDMDRSKALKNPSDSPAIFDPEALGLAAARDTRDDDTEQ